VNESTWALVAHPVIPATQEAEIRRTAVQSQPREVGHKTVSQKTLHKKGLVEWFKVKALSSSLSTTHTHTHTHTHELLKKQVIKIE
jgi:hypothetical protein